MIEELRELDCVALLNDLPSAGLSRGQTGAVELAHNSEEAFEVEFPTSARDFVVLTIMREDLLRLRGLEFPTAAGKSIIDQCPSQREPRLRRHPVLPQIIDASINATGERGWRRRG
jgi:hypothetical protein